MDMTVANQTDPVDLAIRLMTAASITPATGAVFDVLEAALKPLGFDVHRFVAGEAPDGPVENLFATRAGTGSAPHFAFAGHLDVVPPGDGWTSAPFTPEIRGDLLYGRGAVDMKGSIAAFVAAIPADHPGRISLIITGDEEGPATYGTKLLIKHMQERDLVPDFCLVGEPTSVNRTGDMVKIGRRGSSYFWITVPGVQGHVAYPHLADNPVPKLIRAMAALDALHLDDGTDWFQPSTLTMTDLEVGNPTTNVIPSQAKGRIAIRFNDLHTGASIVDLVERTVRAHAPEAEITHRVTGESFITDPGPLSDMIAASIKDVTDIETELSTTGGTSDARFLSKICPVAEFGLTNATMHKRDEAVAVEDLHIITRIYARILERAAA
jgi:succinyl-diaminopimelate desuccinylase